MPVHDSIRTGCEMTVGLKAQLAWVRQPTMLTLCLRFEQQVIAAACRTCHVAAECDLLAGECILARMVDVDAADVECAGGTEMVDRRL